MFRELVKTIAGAVLFIVALGLAGPAGAQPFPGPPPGRPPGPPPGPRNFDPPGRPPSRPAPPAGARPRMAPAPRRSPAQPVVRPAACPQDARQRLPDRAECSLGAAKRLCP